MIYLALAELVVIVLLIALVHLVVQDAGRRYAEAEERWARERQTLLTRIQRPEYLPPTRLTRPAAEAPEGDEINRVGTIA